MGSNAFVCNRGTTFVARRAPIEGARPIPFTGASSNLTPQHLFGQGAFRCCPELSMTIWSAYISLEQVYLGLLGHFDPTLHPQVGMAPHMRCQIDHRVVRTLAADHMSTTRVPGFKPSSNSTIPEAWITDPATESWSVIKWY